MIKKPYQNPSANRLGRGISQGETHEERKMTHGR